MIIICSVTTLRTDSSMYIKEMHFNSNSASSNAAGVYNQGFQGTNVDTCPKYNNVFISYETTRTIHSYM